MSTQREPVYAFIAKWFDPHAQIVRRFNLRYFVANHNVEIIDTKTNRLFLKKTQCPAAITTKDFYLGSKLLIYGRSYELMEFLDQFTASALGQTRQKSIAIITPDAVKQMGSIIDTLSRSEFTLSALKMVQLTPQETGQLMLDPAAAQALSARPVVAIEVVADDCIAKLKQLKSILQAKSGANNNATGIFLAETEAQVDKQAQIFFQTKHAPTAKFDNCSCCVIQPHAVKEGLAGQIIQALQQDSYEISAIELFNLERASAAEFLEVYEGVVPHFHDAVNELTTGPCIAMEIRGQDAVPSLRQAAGPWDIEMAKELRPHTIRARFGKDRVQNAIHCTDLPEDGVLESQYFFDILARK